MIALSAEPYLNVLAPRSFPRSFELPLLLMPSRAHKYILPMLTDWFIVTGPVARFARQIAGQGYIVAAPSSYHEFTGPEPLAYDVPGTDAGNEWKVKKVPHALPPLS